MNQQRHCKRFYCDERGDRYCCVDCHLRSSCYNPCLNHPVRCGLVSTAHRKTDKDPTSAGGDSRG